jgi:hypothetical protein
MPHEYDWTRTSNKLPPINGVDRFIGRDAHGEEFIFNYYEKGFEGELVGGAEEGWYPASYLYGNGVIHPIGLPVEWMPIPCSGAADSLGRAVNAIVGYPRWVDEFNDSHNHAQVIAMWDKAIEIEMEAENVA